MGGKSIRSGKMMIKGRMNIITYKITKKKRKEKKDHRGGCNLSVRLGSKNDDPEPGILTDKGIYMNFNSGDELQNWRVLSSTKTQYQIVHCTQITILMAEQTMRHLLQRCVWCSILTFAVHFKLPWPGTIV